MGKNPLRFFLFYIQILKGGRNKCPVNLNFFEVSIRPFFFFSAKSSGIKENIFISDEMTQTAFSWYSLMFFKGHLCLYSRDNIQSVS